MGFAIAKAIVLLQLSVLFVSCFTVFGDVIDPESLSAHYHGHDHYPVMAPSHPPSHHHHHHHHHGHAPSPSPVPVLPPSPAPSHHHHKGHPPSHAPVHPPMMHPPTHAPSRPPVHPPVYPPMSPPTQHPRLPPGYHFPRSFVAVQGVVYCKSCKYAGVDTLLGAKPLSDAIVKLQCYNTKYRLVQLAKTDKNGYFYIEAPKTITNYGAHKCKVFLVPSSMAKCRKPSDLHGGLKGAILKPEKPFVSRKLPFVLFSVGPLAFEPKCPR